MCLTLPQLRSSAIEIYSALRLLVIEFGVYDSASTIAASLASKQLDRVE